MIFQKVGSPLYIKVVGIFQEGVSKGHRVLSFHSLVILSVIERILHQFVGVVTMCFCRLFDNRFILRNESHENLKALVETTNPS